MIARKLKIKLILVIILLCQITTAQLSNFKAKINPNSKSGYHKIKLSPELVAVSNPDLSDIRVLDKTGHQVPYYVEYSQPSAIIKIDKKVFELKQYKLNKFSIIEFQNFPQRLIDNISLIINNTKINKQVTVLGSLDNKNWYSLIDKEILSDLYDNNSTKIEKNISLPKSNYSYYRVLINDSNTAPIVINEIFNNEFTQENRHKIYQIKGHKLSYFNKGNDNIIEFNSNYKYKIDELTINTKNKELFDRRISILTETKIKKRTQSQVVYESHITNNNSNFTGLNLTESKFKIEISNGDNQPLDIKSIDFYQYPIFLVSELDSTQNYTIITGDKSATAPSYDIVNFKDKIPSDIPIIDISNLESTSSVIENSSSQKFYQQKWFMWSCLALGVLVVFYISIFMINSMNKKED